MAFPAVRIPQELSRPGAGPAPVRLGHGTATGPCACPMRGRSVRPPVQNASAPQARPDARL